jgi:hypothetical protein
VRGRFIRFNDSENQSNEVVVSKWFYALEVPKRSHVFITLHQEDERVEGVLPRRPYLDAGMVILKMDKEEGSKVHHYKDYVCKRESEVELVLEEGSYIIVPRTTGCLLRRPENADVENIRLLDQQGGFHPYFEATVNDIFNKFDLVINNAIDFKEFKGFSEMIGKPIGDEMAFKDQILAKFNSHPEKGLTLKGFKDYWKQAILGDGEAMIWNWLEKLGYDRDLFSVRSRLFNLTVQSRCLDGDSPVEMRIRDAIETDIDSKTNEMVVSQFGDQEATGDGYTLSCKFSKSVYSFSYTMTNTGSAPIEAVLDMSSCENMSFSTRGPLIKKLIQPGESQFMMHAQAGFGEFTKSVRHSAKEAAGGGK